MVLSRCTITKCIIIPRRKWCYLTICVHRLNSVFVKDTCGYKIGSGYETFVGFKESLEDRLFLVISGEQFGVVVV